MIFAKRGTCAHLLDCKYDSEIRQEKPIAWVTERHLAMESSLGLPPRMIKTP